MLNVVSWCMSRARVLDRVSDAIVLGRTVDLAPFFFFGLLRAEFSVPRVDMALKKQELYSPLWAPILTYILQAQS